MICLDRVIFRTDVSLVSIRKTLARDQQKHEEKERKKDCRRLCRRRQEDEFGDCVNDADTVDELGKEILVQANS